MIASVKCPADYAIANVQCQYESGSDGEGKPPAGAAGAAARGDHSYEREPIEPPAFIISLPTVTHVPSSALVTSCNNGASILPPGVSLAPSIAIPNARVISIHPPRQDTSDGNRRVRRSEELLRQAADCVSRGHTFQTVSDQFNIPISTIRFFMARKGILPQRRRGRSAQAIPTSPTEPPYHIQHYKLPDMLSMRSSDSNDAADKPL